MNKEYRLMDFHSPVRNKGMRIAFPESTDPRILKASRFLADEKLAVPVLVGDRDDINEAANRHDVSLEGIEIAHILPDRFAQQLADLRKEKGMTLEQAKEILRTDATYYATMLLHNNQVQGVVGGAVNTTAQTLRPALQVIKCKPGVPIASSFFIMETERGVWFFADCSINIDPDAQQLAYIGVTTAQTAKKFGVDPKVAFLSFSTHGSGKHAKSEKVANATALAKAQLPGVPIEGEMQVDAAMDEFVGKAKGIPLPVGGHANIFIFPDVDSGNIGYKLVERFAEAEAIGPIVQGLNKPVNDLSRGCTTEDIVEVACITAMQALHW